MRLSGPQFEKLKQALLSAYPTRDSLEQLVRFELEIVLETIADGKNLGEVTFRLIAWAEECGIVEDLVAKACKRNPGSIELRVVAEQLANQLSTTPKLIDSSIKVEGAQLLLGDKVFQSPLPESNQLKAPGGGMQPHDQFYVVRDADLILQNQLLDKGTTTTIHAPRQTGKTSMLIRGLHYAAENSVKVVYLDFQSIDSEHMASLDTFLYELAESICNELNLSDRVLEKAWHGLQGPTKKLTRFLENDVLPLFNEPIILAIDEADCLLNESSFHRDFFGLVRSWHNRRAHRPVWGKLNIILVISTEPYLLIDDIHQSPFNVSFNIYLTDFNQTQVQTLNQQHGSPLRYDDLPAMMALFHGHPFLTRQALYTMVINNWSWSMLAHSISFPNGPFSNHLNHHYSMLRKNLALIDSLKEIIRTNRCSDEMSLFRLMQAGLIKGSGNIYTCRCDLYKIFFEDKLLRS